MSEESSEQPCSATRHWVDSNECGEMSVSSAVIVGFIGCWTFFFVVASLRLKWMTNTAATGTAVAKKMQFLQGWFYSLIYTLVSVSSLFLAITLFVENETIGGGLVIVAFIASAGYASQIDVIGTVGKNPGINNIDPIVMVQYFLTTYLAKAVWKLTGHKETGTDRFYNENKENGVEEGNSNSDDSPISALGSLCCMSEVWNSHRPKVYDFKDVVAAQGAFLSIPVLLILAVINVRAFGVASFEEDGGFEFEEFYLFRTLPTAFTLAAASAVLAPLLGDWETFKKSKIKSLFSVFFRVLELSARGSFYAFFIDKTKFAALFLLFVEFMAMWLTSVKARDTSSAGRTGTVSHKLLASWESIFFTNYRRVHVDKELIMENTSLMPVTIEFVRFILKTLVTAVGFAIIMVDLPESYSLSTSSENSLPTLFVYAGVSNALLFLLNMVNFLCINRSELKKEDLGRITTYWSTLPVCHSLCAPNVVYINRDNVQYQNGTQHYL